MKESYHDEHLSVKGKSLEEDKKNVLDNVEDGDGGWKELIEKVNKELEKQKQLRRKELNEKEWKGFIAIAQTKTINDCKFGEDLVFGKFLEIEGHKIYKLDGVEGGINYFVGDEDITCLNESLNSGIMFFKVGGCYVGEIKGGLPNGEGTYIMKDGNRLEGKREDGEMSGQGVYTRVNGSVLDSNDWNKDGPRNGKIKINIEGKEYDFEVSRGNNSSNWEIKSEGDYKGGFINRETGELL